MIWYQNCIFHFFCLNIDYKKHLKKIIKIKIKIKKLASLLLTQKKPLEAQKLIDTLLAELKKLDDKQMLTETHLTEARVYHSLQNIPKCLKIILKIIYLCIINFLFALCKLMFHFYFYYYIYFYYYYFYFYNIPYMIILI
jgi:hypothetical protein